MVEKEIIVPEKCANSANTKVQADTEEEDDDDKKPQVDGTVDEIVSYDLEMESFASATEKDVVEVLEANFHGTLDDKNIEKTDTLRNIMIEKLEKEEKFLEENRKI